MSCSHGLVLDGLADEAVDGWVRSMESASSPLGAGSPSRAALGARSIWLVEPSCLD
jgi:hypothetical protein